MWYVPHVASKVLHYKRRHGQTSDPLVPSIRHMTGSKVRMAMASTFTLYLRLHCSSDLLPAASALSREVQGQNLGACNLWKLEE